MHRAGPRAFRMRVLHSSSSSSATRTGIIQDQTVLCCPAHAQQASNMCVTCVRLRAERELYRYKELVQDQQG
eukprot:6189202-Pyramimonas_sp.AAC.2